MKATIKLLKIIFGIPEREKPKPPKKNGLKFYYGNKYPWMNHE